MPCEAISVDGLTITPATLPAWQGQCSGVHAELADFLRAWWSDAPTMELHTSGSTGKPKCIHASKAAMRASAAATCRAFQLQPGHTALLALPLRYIAGQMMVVRALVGGLHLITTPPSSTPLAGIGGGIDFAPLVPMQVASTLAVENGAQQLARVRTILLGGGFVDAALEAQLQSLPCRVFTSYGMTETLSHIALRAANGPQRSEFYTPLPGVSISASPQNTLQLSAPHLDIDHLVTNDTIELLPDGRFRILGRVDAVINSGGVKIQAEELEQELHCRTGLHVLALPMPHPVLGQCVALLWEGPAEAETALRDACATLPRYHQPHAIFNSTLPRTSSGKPARAEARQLLSQLTRS